jgi:hypothetical protein
MSINERLGGRSAGGKRYAGVKDLQVHFIFTYEDSTKHWKGEGDWKYVGGVNVFKTHSTHVRIVPMKPSPLIMYASSK